MFAFPSIQGYTWAAPVQINCCSLPVSKVFCFPHRVAASSAQAVTLLLEPAVQSGLIGESASSLSFPILFKLAVGLYFFFFKGHFQACPSDSLQEQLLSTVWYAKGARMAKLPSPV